MRNSTLHLFLVLIVFSLLALLLHPASASSGSDYDYGAQPRFVCTPIPVDVDPSCIPAASPGVGAAGSGAPEAKATILHLRESLVQQKETILDQRETIRELTAKLTLCEGFGRGVTPHDDHPSTASHSHQAGVASHHTYNDNGHYSNKQGHHGNSNLIPDSPHHPSELLQRKISALEQQLQRHQTATLSSSGKKSKSPDAFQISFPMRTNYMYGRVKRTLLQEIFALTLCLWIKAGVGPGLGTPFSYSAPGQANELVLIEWGNNPIELLINDQAATLPLSLSDGKWHHICVTWSTRDGQWEAYQDGVQRGSGTNLSPWHPIKPGGVFILGQEQDTLGGRFDATQSFVGEMSDLHMWSHALSAADIYSLASCGSHLRGDVIAWSDSEVELHGGVARYPFDPCH
uniref:Pentraxin (PTX) domain-containing protein n=1 Tax=Anabas testudineus TaxID=64144 RepID=A0A3Q1JDU3_ANATE